jgi:hypothetical protein
MCRKLAIIENLLNDRYHAKDGHSDSIPNERFL